MMYFIKKTIRRIGNIGLRFGWKTYLSYLTLSMQWQNDLMIDKGSYRCNLVLIIFKNTEYLRLPQESDE